MNIYLDVDGVILLDEKHAAPYVDEFLQHILNKYPETTYWLTTPKWKEENTTIDILTPLLNPQTAKLLDKIKPSEWEELKTDAINFEEDFLWFDDDLWPEELKVLEDNNATGRFVMVDLAKDSDMLKELIKVL